MMELMEPVSITCSRCNLQIEGLRGPGGTSGFYDLHEPSPWAKFAKSGEEYLCDPCMQASVDYQGLYDEQVGLVVTLAPRVPKTFPALPSVLDEVSASAIPFLVASIRRRAWGNSSTKVPRSLAFILKVVEGEQGVPAGGLRRVIESWLNQDLDEWESDRELTPIKVLEMVIALEEQVYKWRRAYTHRNLKAPIA